MTANYDPDIARRFLAEWAVEAERGMTAADTLQEHADQHRDRQHSYERKVRILVERMLADGLEPYPRPS